jgi:uncharacterized protein YegL
MEIQARLTHSKIDHSQDSHTHLVVTLKAPQLDWVAKRPSICVVPVIDLSGSMMGAKLEYAQKSMLKLVDQLQPGDVVGLVGFESKSHMLMRPQEATPEVKLKLKGIIQKLHTLGGTNLYEGAAEAVKVIKELDLDPRYIKRAILFTDGQPTDGVTDKKQITRLIKENLGSVTVSAFGYGGGGGIWNGCDQDFLTDCAREWSGNYAYVSDPDDALTAFGRELGGLLSTYAQNIRVEIEPLNGHQVEKVVTDIPMTQNALGETEFTISDILAEEARNFVFSAKLLQQAKSGPRAVNVFRVVATYSTLTADGTRETKTVETKVKAQFVSANEAQKDPHKDLDEAVALAQVVRAQLDAEALAKKGEYKTAAAVMDNLAAGLGTRGLHQTARIASNVSHRVGTEALYAQSAGYLRSMSYGGTRAMGLSGMDEQAAADLGSVNIALSNSTMTSSVESFVADEPGPVIPPDFSLGGQVAAPVGNFLVSAWSKPYAFTPEMLAALDSTLLTGSSVEDPVVVLSPSPSTPVK